MIRGRLIRFDRLKNEAEKSLVVTAGDRRAANESGALRRFSVMRFLPAENRLYSAPAEHMTKPAAAIVATPLPNEYFL